MTCSPLCPHARQAGAGREEAEGGPAGQPAGGAGPAQSDRLPGQLRALHPLRAGTAAAGERAAAEQVSAAMVGGPAGVGGGRWARGRYTEAKWNLGALLLDLKPYSSTNCEAGNNIVDNSSGVLLWGGWVSRSQQMTPLLFTTTVCPCKPGHGDGVEELHRAPLYLQPRPPLCWLIILAPEPHQYPGTQQPC